MSVASFCNNKIFDLILPESIGLLGAPGRFGNSVDDKKICRGTILTDQFPVFDLEVSFKSTKIARLGNSIRIKFYRFDVVVSYVHH